MPLLERAKDTEPPSLDGTATSGIRKLRSRPIIHVLLILLATTLTFVPMVPHDCKLFVVSDSVIFLYTGQQLLSGAGLYTEVWDHKPPLIFYLNALGLWIGRGHPAGVLFLTFVSSSLFFILCYLLAAWYFGRLAVLAAVFLAVSVFRNLMPNPNLTEVFMLPLQALSVGLAFREWFRSSAWWMPLVQGVLAALLFFLRANGIGAPLLYVFGTVFLLLGHHRPRPLLKRLALLTLGTVATTGLLLIPFIRTGTLTDMLYAAITFNIKYSGTTTWTQKASVLLAGLAVTSPISLLAVSTLLAACAARIWYRVDLPPIVTGASGLFLLEFMLSGISGRHYNHYYLPWILPLALLLAYFWHMFLGSGSDGSAHEGKVLLLSVLVALVTGSSIVQCVHAVRNASGLQVSAEEQIVRTVQFHSGVDDRVYVWDNNHTGVLFRIGRRSPSRFSNLAPLLSTSRSIYLELVPSVLTDLEQKRPKLIVEYENAHFPPLFLDSLAASALLRPRPKYYWDDDELRRRKSQLQLEYKMILWDPGAQMAVFASR